MRTTVVSVFLVAAAVSAAAATPAKTESSDRVSYGDTARRDTLAPPTGWIELASPTPASHGREYIALETSIPLVRLRVTAAAGRPIVRNLRIDFMDGTSRIVRVDRVVDKRRPAIIDLRGPRHIERIVVISEGSRAALYSVSGEPQGTGIASR